MEPEIQSHIRKGYSRIPVLGQTNSIPRIDAYFFKIHYIIVLPSTPRPT